jgi:hypothetical protein
MTAKGKVKGKGISTLKMMTAKGKVKGKVISTLN